MSTRLTAPVPLVALAAPVSMGVLARRLAAPGPGWAVTADVVVVGSGIAGLTAALYARNALQGRGAVLLVTKALLDDGSTRWAQGGIAAATGPGDTPEHHFADTLTAGGDLCDSDAVRVLVTEGPGAFWRLIGLGARFDRGPDGEIALTREGGHLRNRIAHAGGDATGAEISRALVSAVRAGGGIEVIEHALVLDVMLDGTGRAAGVTLHVMGEGQRDGVGAVLARAVVLATGGMGQVFAATTNPAVSTGDGVALALRAGAAVTDLEFVQFHPTILWLGAGATGQQPLISEAVRGEGAVLVDSAGVRFMIGQHPLAELAPRDVVAKAITRRMQEAGTNHVFLDARGLGRQTLLRRFPSIVSSCRTHGIDPVTDLIPVTPAAHYASGGVRTDLYGRTSVPGLYACGEVACTGVHGANRLASNSLLEGLVFAERIATDLARGLPPLRDPDSASPGGSPGAAASPDAATSRGGSPDAAASSGGAGGAGALSGGSVSDPPGNLVAAGVRTDLARAMSDGAGVLRSAESLARAAKSIGSLADRLSGGPCTETWEATNLVTVASALVATAVLREETRGCHWREDYADRDDERWLGHLVTRLDDEGRVVTWYEQVRR